MPSASRCATTVQLPDAGTSKLATGPIATWQRPTNENGNAFVRRYVGKGTDLSVHTTRQLRAIEHRINTTPRRILNWSNANDIYTAQIAPTS